MNLAIIFAGGSGTRMGSDIPKQFLQLVDRPVLAHTLGIFQSHPEIDGIYLVVHRDWEAEARKIAADYGITKLRGIAFGGASAQESIYNGLCYAAERESPDAVVLLHDGARPYLTPQVIADNIAAVRRYGNAVTYTPCFETLVLSRDGQKVDGIPARRESYSAQAPQSFVLKDILGIHAKIRQRPEGYEDMVDQATICFTLGIPVHLVQGCRGNVKLTTPEDLVTLAALLEWRARHG